MSEYMITKFNIDSFLKQYPFAEEEIRKNNIDVEVLGEIYADYISVKDTYENQADFIANILRTHPKVHSVKSRIKQPGRLIEKVIRKTEDRKNKYNDDFQFNIDNYKEEINDLIGIRVIHIFKQEWEEIHKFILDTWKVVEITANVREGDDTKRFEELDIQIKSRKSGYRSVHYLIEFYPTSQKVIAEIQVRTIFEEGYGEIDHQLRYSHKEIPEILESNLLLFNRISGSADEMASMINLLNKNLCKMDSDYKTMMEQKDQEIRELKERLKKS
jgi:ppGpp synthetase/RelA/SpoT-type nucleotidyltranferase